MCFQELKIPLQIDPLDGKTLQSQVFERIRELILSGQQLTSGMALPPTRRLAESLRVSRNTISLAYDRLTAEGYTETRGTAGTFVSTVLPDGMLQVSTGMGQGDGIQSKLDMPSPLLCFAGYRHGLAESEQRPAYDFWVGRSEPSAFPVAQWQKILVKKLTTAGAALTEYGDPAGLADLRIAITKHIHGARGMQVSMEQIIVTGGSQDGLNLICRLLEARRHPFFVENPCYQGAALLFLNFGAELHPVPVDEHGMLVDRLPRDRAGVVFVTPSHQYPTGATLSLQRRVQLLRWAEETNSIIIEDDYDSDFRYAGPPLTSLAALDGSRRVFYLGTFSKSLGAGLRAGFVVVPKEMADPARIVKSQMNSGQPWLDQAVLATFLDSGLFDRHLRRTVKLYKGRRDALIASLRRAFGEVEIRGAEAGLHITWRLPPGSPTARRVERRAAEYGVGVYSLASGAAADLDDSTAADILVLGYSSLSESQIHIAVNRLREVLEELRHGAQ
jgi:GntR family transcriptional regulator/MocR family aminotransferase